MPPADGRCRASSPIENAVNRTATSAKTTARGVMPPARRGREPDRQGDGDRRRHEGDGLEQHLGEADRSAFESWPAGSPAPYVAAIASTSARVAGAGACVAVAREWVHPRPTVKAPDTPAM